MGKANKPFEDPQVQYSMPSRGLVLVYTGEGKGKTTAALGLVLRAVGYKKAVLVVQFGKVWFTGEKEGIKHLPNVKLIQGGISFVGIIDDKSPFLDHVKVAEETYEVLYKELVSGKWDIVVVDEIIGAVAGKLLKEEYIERLVKDKPEMVDLVLTGHHATKKIMDLADLVTEMKEVKHPYQKGILAKPAIDY